MDEFLARLRSSPRKKIALEDLRHTYFALHPDVQSSPERGALLLDELRKLEAKGAIALPAPGSWERTGTPALPKWIMLVREAEPVNLEDYSRVPWAPELGFWTELKQRQMPAAKAINEFLLRRRGAFRPVPVKERSLEIFGDEKALDTMRSGASLFSGRLALATLGAFQVPLPLPYRQADAPGRPVLVVENHNSFWSFGEWNHSAKRYSAVVYGAGEAFRSTGAALGQALRDVDGNGAEYLGDLDPKGIRIPQDFNRTSAPDEPKVRPALDLYQWLLQNGRRREKPDCLNAEELLATNWLGPALGAELTAIWQQGLWIPQEGLGYEQLVDWPE
jgi:hypothetical protein